MIRCLEVPRGSGEGQKPITWLVTLLLSSCLFACSPVGNGSEPPMISDSAGVQIVESVGPAWSRGEVWTVPGTPVLEIGDVGGNADYLFGRVTNALRQANGRILVADAQANLIRAYDEHGTFITNWGGEGEGPGEFRRLQWLWRKSGDSILATEFIGPPSLFSPDGVFERRIDFQLIEWARVISPEMLRTNSGGYILGYSEDGTLLARLAGVVPRQEGIQREMVGVLRFDEASAKADTLLVSESAPYRVERTGGRLGVRELTHWDPRAGFAVHGETLFVGLGDSYSFKAFDRDGRLTRISRLLRPRPAVTDKIRESYREYRSQWWGRAMEPGVEPGRLQQFESTPFPDSLPSFNQLRTDALGNLWAEEHPSSDWGDYSRNHLVFDSTGVFLGRVTMPKGLWVTEIGADYVLGIWKDEYEVDFVRLYELRKE